MRMERWMNNKNTYTLKTLKNFKIIFLIAAIALTGCETMPISKSYAYTDAKETFEWGEFTGRLLEKSRGEDGNASTRKYELVIIFSSKIQELNIVVDDISLIDKERENTVFKKSKIMMPELTWNKCNKHYSTVRIVDILSLDYEDYRLMLKYHIKDIKVNKVYKINEIFITDYKEENITAWDMIMGV